VRTASINEAQPGRVELGQLQRLQPIKRQYEELQPKMQKAEIQEREKHQHKEPGHDKLQPRRLHPIESKPNKLHSSKPQHAEPNLKPHKVPQSSPHRRLTPNEVKNLVDGALEVLKEEYPEEYALLYELYFNGASLHALSRTLRVPRSTLRSRKKKALLHLKAIIDNSQKQFGIVQR
jgi:DNA-directed RNA polymerase specialized sigma24 family protein